MSKAYGLLLSFLVADAAVAAQLFPVPVQLLSPGTAQVLFQVPAVTIEDIAGPLFSWTMPGSVGSGSGSLAISAGLGKASLEHVGQFQSNGGGALSSVSIDALPIVQIDVPDFGDATTALGFVVEAAELSVQGSADSFVNANLYLDEPYASERLGSKLSTEHLPFEGYASVHMAPGRGTPETISEGGGLAVFVAGDRLTLPLRLKASTYCSSESPGSCSISWRARFALKVLAVAPEHQNRPATACFDGQDNDGDGRIDLRDPDCESPSDTTEAAPPAMMGCGIGPELAVLLPLLAAARTWRRARASR